MITVSTEPLTPAAFAPFGDVLQVEGADQYDINAGTTKRFDALAHVRTDPAGTAAISIFRAIPHEFPITIRSLERHPLGSQAFMPLSPHSWLAVVAEHPVEAEVRCFLVTGHQGVQYHRNTWHHPLLVLQPEQDFLVIDRVGPGANLERTNLDVNVQLALM
jgi:ureidoglycolate lyase